MSTGFNTFLEKAASHDLKPNIINNESNFVVVTYWWGRGNLNKNTQRPCPEDLKPNESLTKPPIMFEKMIENWENSCKKHKCNYLAEEYAEFAVKGGYQHAINFKPYFIQLALEASYPRAVLYIDGDMRIKIYPSICDTKDVDYMARGWNTDPRPGNWRYTNKFCFDPYVFEMSGGTMFFNNTYHARNLLALWQEYSLVNSGKSDDRILSLAMMLHTRIVELSTLQLPVEYLWLDMDYDYYLEDGVDYSSKKVTISHPECLTGEDRATTEGAATNRYPKAYDRFVSNFIWCEWEEIYEYLQFETKDQIAPFKKYFEFLENHGVLDVIPYSKKYGPYNKIVEHSLKLVDNAKIKIHDNLVVVSPHNFDTRSLHLVGTEREAIVTILKYLMNNQSVVYVPQTSARSVGTVITKAVKEHLDFVVKNVQNKKIRAKLAFSLKIDRSYPMYFGPNSRILKQLLAMSDSFDNMEKLFNRTYIFLTRIHCGWL